MAKNGAMQNKDVTLITGVVQKSLAGFLALTKKLSPGSILCVVEDRHTSKIVLFNKEVVEDIVSFLPSLGESQKNVQDTRSFFNRVLFDVLEVQGGVTHTLGS